MNEQRSQSARMYVIASMLGVAAALLGALGATLTGGALQVLLIVVALLLLVGAGAAIRSALDSPRGGGPPDGRGH